MKTIKDAVIQFSAQWPEGATHLIVNTGFPGVAKNDITHCRIAAVTKIGDEYRDSGGRYDVGGDYWQVLCDRQQFEAALWDGAPDWAVDIRVSSMGFLWWTDGKSLVESIEDGSGGRPGWFSELKVVATRSIPVGTDINDLKSATYTVPAPGHDWYDYKTQQMLSVPPAGIDCEVLTDHGWQPCKVVAPHPQWPNTTIVCFTSGVATGMPHNTGNIRPLDWDREFRPLIDAAVNVIRTCPSKQAETLAAALYDAGLLQRR